MARIYSEQRGIMYATAYRHVGNRPDAEDAVQDAAVLLMQQRKATTNERGLAYTVAHHAAHGLMQRERYRRHERIDSDAPAHHGRSPSAEREAMAAVELGDVAASAPVEAVLLGQGYLLREVAAMTGQDYRTIWSRVDKWRRERVKAQDELAGGEK